MKFLSRLSFWKILAYSTFENWNNFVAKVFVRIFQLILWEYSTRDDNLSYVSVIVKKKKVSISIASSLAKCQALRPERDDFRNRIRRRQQLESNLFSSVNAEGERIRSFTGVSRWHRLFFASQPFRGDVGRYLCLKFQQGCRFRSCVAYKYCA